MAMSDDGNHFAIVTPKGSRTIVMVDGVEGPIFDEIPQQALSTSVSVQFSPTGGHSAYIGRRGTDQIAVIDGKEAGTVVSGNAQGYFVPGWKFLFTQDGSTVAYASYTGPNSWVMVTNGSKSPAYKQIDFSQYASAGKRIVYVAQTADGKFHVVVDGTPGPAYDQITSLLLTPDGAHYAFIANKAGGNLVVTDGVEGKLYPGRISDLDQAPDGRVDYMALNVSTQGHGGSQDLIVGGLTVSNSTTYSTMLSNGNRSPLRRVAWSPDGKRFAYIQLNAPNPGAQVMLNGKPLGLTYNGAGDLTWSADGSRLAYIAQAANGLSFFVIDGQESQGFNSITEFKLAPPDGKRYALMGYVAGTGFSLILDGNPVPKARDYYKGSMGFSPDGKHFAYAATPNIQNYVAIVDGTTTPFALSNWQTTRTYPATGFPAFVWSADGNHLAYVGQKTDASIRMSVVVDGSPYLGPTQSYSFPAFSPDGKHFATLTWAGSGGRRIMIDGKLSDGYDDILESSLAGVGWTDAHTYRFYGVKAGTVYRVTIGI